MKPLVSIVIPTYNRANDLRRALNSVIAQSYSSWEAIVVDNHSSDDTNDVIQHCRDSRIRLIKIYNHGVIAASRNKGMREAQGQYIAFLDSDDWWMPQKLEISIQHLEQGYDVCYHDLSVVKKEVGQVLKKRMRGRQVSQPVYDDLIKNGNAIYTSSIVVRTDILKKVGGQLEEPDLVAGEDYECWLRISKETERFVYIPKVLGYYWKGQANTSNPERYITYLERLQELHIKAYTEEHNTELPVWWEYDQVRSLYFVDKATAHPVLKQMLTRPLPWITRLKLWWMRISSYRRSDVSA